jgi:hypothetical protein
MLQQWTSLDILGLAGANINSPSNAILLSADNHYWFGDFSLWFEAVRGSFS